jgi:hypothetical protein
MGHDLTIIGRHKLNTSTPQKLATDLSKALKARVEYAVEIWNSEMVNSDGYKGEYEYFNQFTVGGEYQKAFSLYAKIEDVSKFNPETYYEDKTNFYLEVTENGKDRSFNIGLDTLEVDCRVNCRWYTWVEWFKDPDYSWDNIVPCRNWIENQRHLIYDELKLYGGSEVLIFSDQQEFQNIEFEIMYKTFDQIKNEFQEAVGDKVRYIPKELAGYPQKDKYEKTGVENFPVFYDDFVGIEH